MVYVILVTYYPKNAQKALDGLIRFIDTLPFSCRIICVNNNGENLSLKKRISDVEILGSNERGEFSGWTEGLLHTRAWERPAGYIFVNDTFNNHRAWTPKLAESFRGCFQQVLKSPVPGMGGEVNSFETRYSICGFEDCSWISTYLFVMNSSALEMMGWNIEPPPAELAGAKRAKSSQQIYLEFQFSPELRNHVEHWLSPDEPRGGWYGARSLDEQGKLRKVRAIAFEKYLSARARNLGIKRTPIKLGIVDKTIHRIQKKFGLAA